MTEGLQQLQQLIGSLNGTLILYAVYIFMLAVFVGFEVISKVPVQLHTPLMSGTNAIHGIVMLGGMLVLAESGKNGLLTWLGFAAVVLGAMNLFGGFVVTDRMLEMFKTKKPAAGAK
jgi:NAD(P) transhydrogenase subunit alpha